MAKFDVVVVGAGLIGSAMALMLAKHTQLRVAIIERYAPIKAPEEDNQRVVALGAIAAQMLSDLGVLQQLGSRFAHPYKTMRVWDEHSYGELNFAAADMGIKELGYMVDAAACTHILQSKVLNGEYTNLSAFFDCQLSGFTHSKDSAVIRSKEAEYQAKLVIGADGGQSWVRKQAKIFANRRPYSQLGIVTKISTSESHHDCAFQRFLSTGPVAALPLHDNQSSIVWSADQHYAEQLMALDDATFGKELSAAFDQTLGEVFKLSRRQAFPLVSQQTSQYFAPSVALIGDAAHSIHPLAGQGANLGFKDIQCLLKLILETQHPEQIGGLNLLYRYQQKRKPDNEQTDRMMSALNTAYKLDFPLWLSLRGSGMNWLNRSQKIKQILAKHAIGL